MIAVIGFIGIFSILMFTLLTHALGRIFGPSWLLLGFVLYLIYRRHRRLPLFRSQKRDWRTAQIDILRRAGELELMDEYIANIKASDAAPNGFGNVSDASARAQPSRRRDDRRAGSSSSCGCWKRFERDFRSFRGSCLAAAMIALGAHRIALILRVRRAT